MDLVTSFLLLSFHFLLLRPNSACERSFPCGDFLLEFPLTNSSNPGCGLIVVDGCDSESTKTILGPAGSSYTILQQMSPNKFLVQDTQLLDFFNNNGSCLPFTNLSMPQFYPLSFTYSLNITLFTCYNQTSDNLIQDYFSSYRRININSGRSRCQPDITTVYYMNETTDDLPDLKNDGIPTACSMIQLPLEPAGDGDDLLSWSNPNFALEWSVPEHCFPSETLNEYDCSGGKHRILKKTLFIGGITMAALTSTLIILYVFIRRKRAKGKQELEKDIKLFLRNNGNLAPMRYKYSSIKKITKSFSEKLGKGGYGSVYKGQLPDGHLVAVKVLDESNGNGEDFMNEVASISRTSHINIVALLGFCFEGSKRALIYDFMPNGSLEKFIDNTASSAAEFGLGLDQLFEIALGVARGLEYLHQGCNTRILHLDIKPQNILLDKDFTPRISDFGLAKMCPNRSSIVSMMVARGTIGYIAPEVFSRNFGKVSYKSDVYSYGMLVLEMVGGRQGFNRSDVDHTSEIYFPNYIYRQLEMDGDVVEIMNEDETRIAKRNLIIIGLWCIQTNPKDRPSMTKVVEMLEGKLGALEVPPKPYLSSPPRSATTISSTSQSM